MLGKSEEQLTSTDCQSTVSQQITNSLPKVNVKVNSFVKNATTVHVQGN